MDFFSTYQRLSVPVIKRRFVSGFTAFIIALLLPVSVWSANTVFIYSSVNTIRGINLTLGQENLLTTASLSATVNALAINIEEGLVYYGDQTSVYYWDPALGAGGGAHALINNFANGVLQAPLTNINSAAGSFLDGKYYVGSENDNGFIVDIFELSMSADGRQVVSVEALNIFDACNCSQLQLGGFGDIAAVSEAGQVVIYGSTGDLTNNGGGTAAGVWRFQPSIGSWELLGPGFGGQMAGSLDGRVFTSIGNSIRQLDTATGNIGSTSLFTSSAAIFDFTGGFSYDFGDAPDSYGAAFHAVPFAGTSSHFIGARGPDNEAYTLNSSVGASDGQGDDGNASDDEDAFTSLPALSTTDSDYQLRLSCTTGSAVTAWFDSNIDGSFTNNEVIDNAVVNCSNGSAELEWSNLNLAQSGQSYIRIRASSFASDISRPTGYAPDGEVEDYPVTINAQNGNSGNCPAGSVSEIYSATDLPKRIGPNANTFTRSTINVPDSSIITDINLINVLGLHTYVNDVILTLEHNGQTESLYGPACDFRNHFFLGFDDEATGTPPCAPIDGNQYPPLGQLSTYDGQDAQGDWTLVVEDRFSPDGGTLLRWSLEVCTSNGGGNDPDIRLGKSATVDGDMVTMTFRVFNSGDVSLDAIGLVDNLDDVFGVNNFRVIAPPELLSAPNGFVVNTAYTGTSANSVLLNGQGLLAPQDSLTLQFTVQVDDTQASGNGLFFNQAEVKAAAGNLPTVEDLSGVGLDTDVDTDEPTPIRFNPVINLSGFVFEDVSADTLQSHDGVMQLSEPGIAAQELAISSLATGEVLARAVTDGSGFWSVDINAAFAGERIQIALVDHAGYQFISESTTSATGVVSDGITEITLTSNSGGQQIDFGLIRQPVLMVDRSTTAQPGESVLFFHEYTAPTHGAVFFTFETQSGNAQRTELFVDTDCDQQLEASDQLINAPVAVTPNQTVCLLAQVDVPSTAVAGDVRGLELTANLQVDDSSATGHGVQISRQNTDIVRALVEAAGRLVLSKSVSNISAGEAALTQNTALPGDILEYTINYVNEGGGPIRDLVINDQAPAFTLIDSGSASCVSVPIALSCIPEVQGDAIRWDFTGALPAGARGSVSYRITVN